MKTLKQVLKVILGLFMFSGLENHMPTMVLKISTCPPSKTLQSGKGILVCLLGFKAHQQLSSYGALQEK